MDEIVEVARGNKSMSDAAVVLLAAAEQLNLEPAVVKVTSQGTFKVPKKVATKAKMKPLKSEQVEVETESEGSSDA